MSHLSSGAAVGKVLAGAWRSSPPNFEISYEELNQVCPLLLGSGGAALGWRRVRHSEFANSLGASQLREAYYSSAIWTALQEIDLAGIFTLLRSAGVEPILIKGWALARLYPETALRPPGDIDLCVAPQQQDLAESVLRTPEGSEYCVDLMHEEVGKMEDQSFDLLYDRSQLVDLDGHQIRILGPEDHLRILCLHFLKHGGYRPLWLCDIAVALESRPADFNWSLCLGESRRRAHWVCCALALAHQLLGARIERTPVEATPTDQPSWLLPSVLKRWNNPYPVHLPLIMDQIASCWFQPMHLLKSLSDRWPTPVEATIRLRGSFNELPRLPYQVANCLCRAAKLLPQLQRLLRRPATPSS